MEFEHNEERDLFIKTRGKVILNACPGSGKTSTVAYKLIQLVPDFHEKYGKFAGIACLSFTNVAKEEINEKYKQFSNKFLGFPHCISTIDSFINKYITSPFIHLVEDFGKKPMIVDDGVTIDKSIGDNWWFYMSKRHGKFIYKYKPSKIEFAPDGTAYPFKGNDRSDICLEYCKKVKEAQIKLGLLKSTDSEYYALKILNMYPQIGKWLITRFPGIIVDEAQDTSEIQYQIFDKLVELGLKDMEYVGDPYQSLYEWRDARPDLFYKKYQDSENWQALNLNDCRRSGQKIINCYRILRLSNEPDIKSTANIKDELPITIIRYDEGDELLCASKYDELCNKNEINHVVVRGKALKNKLLGLTGNEEKPWKTSLPYFIVSAKMFLMQNNAKSAVNRCRSAIPIIENTEIEYHERREIELALRDDYLWNAKILELLKRIPDFDLTLEQWTTEVQSLLKEEFDVAHDIEFDLKKGIWNKRHREKMKDLFGVPKFNNSVPVSTIHQVKGMTVDSLLLIFSSTSKGQSISFHDYFIPNEFPGEKQRMIYVAMSRPRKHLAIGIPNGNYSNDDIKRALNCDIKFYNS